MTYRGQVKQGKVVVKDAIELPDGTEVTIRPVRAKRKTNARRPTESKTLLERLKPVVGKARDLPSDMSVNLDHYLYGLPKRK